MGAQQLLLRKRGVEVRVTSRTVLNNVAVAAPGTANATASYALQSSGVLRLNAVSDITGEWLVSGVASNYEVRFTHQSGTVPSGVTYGAWLALSSTRTPSLSASRSTTPGITSSTGAILVELRRAGGSGVVLSSATVTVTAEAEVIA